MRALRLSLAAAFVLAACGDATEADVSVSVEAGDTTCVVAPTEFEAGTITFAVTNVGNEVTEVYVYGTDDRVHSEVENIGPGTSRDMTVDLGGGEYEIACKPGQTGDGIRTPIHVAGAAMEEPEADRDVTVDAIDYDFEFDEPLAVTAGETVRFTLINEGTVEHEFEVLGPDGEPLGEVGPTDPEEQGTVVLTFDEPGTYTFVCGIEDHEDKGMVGTFEVS